MVVVFLMAPFLIHRIGEAHYGLYLLLASITGMLGVVDLGLGEATLRYAAHYYGRGDSSGINRAVSATLSVYGVMATLAAVGLFFGVGWVISWFKLSPEQHSLVFLLLRIAAVTFWLRFLAGPFFAVPQALLRYDVSARLRVAESVVRAAGHVAVVLWGAGILGMIVWNLVVAIGFLFASVAAAKWLVPSLRLFVLPTKRGLQEVFGYGLFAFVGNLVGLAWRYADRMLLGAFLGTAAVAYFAVPQEIALRLLGLAAAGGAVLLPKFSNVKRRSVLRRIYLQSSSVLLSFTIVVFVPLAVLMEDFLHLWVSGDFAAQSGLVATIVAASCLVRGAFLPYEALFRGLGKPQYYVVVVALASATVLLTDLILIPRFGLAGAGYAYCLAPIWGFASICFVWFRILKMRNLPQLMTLVFGRMLVGLAALAGCYWLHSFVDPVPTWTGLVLWGTALFIGTALVLIAYERLVSPDKGVIEYLRSRVANVELRQLWVQP